MTPRPGSRTTLIDTDPGLDDALAILLALFSPELDVRGLATVAGNIGLHATTCNAGRLLALAGRADIPVFPGAAAPLERPAPPPLDIHGGDGVGGVPLPEPARPPEPTPAADGIAELLRAEPSGTVDILALGPLTNLARLVLDHRDAAGRLGRVIAMGGAIAEPGNVGPRAEFNLATDPEAADIVLRAGLALTLVPLDVTRRVRATRAFATELAAAGGPVPATAAALIDAYFQSTAGRDSRPLHDPCAVLLAVRPGLFVVRRLRLRVQVGVGKDAGALDVSEEGGFPADVALDVDAPAALDVLRRRLAR